jgi:acetyl-CoA carboxylase biotin carboxyl carrier protein
MIDIRKLKELVRLMVENDLSELDLKDQEETVTIKRGATSGVQVAPPMVSAAAQRPPAAWTGDEPAGTPNGAAPHAAEDAGLAAVESPMVGTFYSSPNPDAGPFVQVGATVGPETTVCLIEAMKVFNEIKAECSGVVERVLVSSGEAVEFGQKLFLVRPS